jgi:hypothetical protein
MQELLAIRKLNYILDKLFNVVPIILLKQGLSFLFEIFSSSILFSSQYKINTDNGNYVVVWKKDGGQWKKVIDIFN